MSYARTCLVVHVHAYNEYIYTCILTSNQLTWHTSTNLFPYTVVVIIITSIAFPASSP